MRETEILVAKVSEHHQYGRIVRKAGVNATDLLIPPRTYEGPEPISIGHQVDKVFD